MSSLSTFSIFSHLPLELQDQIWSHTLPGPRLMRIDYNPVLPNGQYATAKNRNLYNAFPRSFGRQLPTILQVNKESRRYALSQLVERFHCYWNLKIDIPYIHAKEYQKSATRMTLEHLAESGLLDGFRNLAVDIEILNWNGNRNGNTSSDVVASINRCLDLTNLYLVYPLFGIWGDSDGPDNFKPWSVEPPPSEGKTSIVRRENTMRRLPNDVMEYLKNSDRETLENLPGRVSKLNIDMLVWSSMVDR